MKTNVCANRSQPGETELFGTLEGFEETFSKGPAIVSGDGAVTRAELDSRAACVAWHLLSLGIAPGSLIAVCLERSPEWVASLLGIFKAGCAYLPLDPAYPADRLAFMLKDANVAALLAGSAIEKLPRGPWLSVDVREAMRSKVPAVWDPAPEAAPGDLAYVIYTSGSTGQPKGVEVAHGSLSNLIDWHLRTFKVTSADRATLVSSPGFDAGVWELWPYLKAGASLYLPDEEVRLTPALLRDYLVSNRITISFLPTPLAERVMGLEWPKNTALRTLLTGGDRLLRHPPAGLPFTVVNNYGPTECTVVATSTALGAAHNGDLLPPIGLPIANTEIHILDEKLKPVSNGAEGEIYIGGACVARGYRNRAGATTDFVLASDDAEHITAALQPILSKDAILCTDGSRTLAASAKEIGVTHRPVNLAAGIRVIAGVYHVQNVNAYDSRLKGWMRRFKGVATRYLDSYLGWFRALDRAGSGSLNPALLLAQAAGNGLVTT